MHVDAEYSNCDIPQVHKQTNKQTKFQFYLTGLGAGFKTSTQNFEIH